MKLYKFRTLKTCQDIDRVKDIIKNGFYCNDFISFNDMNEGIYTHCTDDTFNLLNQKLQYNICSFSAEESLKSELMWGHYADAGKGIVIEIEVDNIEENSLKKVKYVSRDTRPCENMSLEDILTTKNKEWSYENEYRYLSTDTTIDNKIEIGEITNIYFGTPYESLKNYDKIFKQNADLKIYKRNKTELIEYLNSTNISYINFSFKGLI